MFDDFDEKFVRSDTSFNGGYEEWIQATPDDLKAYFTKKLREFGERLIERVDAEERLVVNMTPPFSEEFLKGYKSRCSDDIIDIREELLSGLERNSK